MNKGESLVYVCKYSDGSVRLRHNDEKGWKLAEYIAYPTRGNTFRLYPARGERHYRVSLAGALISEQIIRFEQP